MCTNMAADCIARLLDARETTQLRLTAVCAHQPFSDAPRPGSGSDASHPTVKIHEYQAKTVLARFGVPIPRGEVAFTPAAARQVAARLGGDVSVIKAQIHAGGRGKGGGVKLARSLDEAEQLAAQIIGMTLVTHQTGPEGKKV